MLFSVHSFFFLTREKSPKCEVSFCGWRGKNSVRCFGSRAERAHGLMLFGEDLSEISKSKFDSLILFFVFCKGMLKTDPNKLRKHLEENAFFFVIWSYRKKIIVR